MATETQIEFGDVAWVGQGPDESSVSCGIEYKQLDDVLTCMVDGRFTGHQLPGLLMSYDRAWLVITGYYREEPSTGILQKKVGDGWRDFSRGRRGFMMRDLQHWTMTLENQTGIRVVEFKGPDAVEMAVRWMVRAHSWWTAKSWQEHQSLHQFHVPRPPSVRLTGKHSLLRRMAKELDGVRWERSAAVEQRFKSAREMVCASVKQWEEVDGIGKVLSRRIVAELTNNKG